MPLRPQSKAKRRGLTKGEYRAIKHKAAHPTATLEEIGRAAGYKHPLQSAWRAMNRPIVKQTIQDMMNERPKLRLSSLLLKVEEGLDAKQTKFFAHEGEVISEVDVIDYGTRHTYLDTALELQGVKKKEEQGVLNISLILNGGGDLEIRAQTADALLQARVARGLHPTENRRLELGEKP